MVSKFAVLANILLASVVLAVPQSFGLEARLARRRENHKSQTIQRIDAPTESASHGVVGYSTNWAGASWDKDNGTFTTVTGIITIPTPSRSQTNGSASAWVGIDGDSCIYAILQTGVDLTITDGKVTYAAWYEWYPDFAYDFDDSFYIDAGHEIKATVIASSKTSGTAIIENLTTGKSVKKALTSNHALCQQDAEWIVEDYTVGDSSVPFANFGTYKFTNATATGPGSSSYTPDGANIIEIKQGNTILTSTSSYGDTLTVKYAKSTLTGQ